MPALTRFIDGTGPVFAGKLFPFAFITIACGAICGFHALIASGTTPKLLERETDARMIGYGAMLMESFVAVMALIAACVLTPGVYFAINAPAGALGTTAQSAAAAIANWGFVVDPGGAGALAQQVGEASLLSRTGGAPSLAVGMAHLFSQRARRQRAMALWYHFAIMFEALFILTTLDAGTRVGRFMLQDLGKHVWEPFGRVSWYPGGRALERDVRRDVGPLPLSGRDRSARRHQLALAAVRHLESAARRGRALRRRRRSSSRWARRGTRGSRCCRSPGSSIVTMTAGCAKIFSPTPKLGFLAHARVAAGGAGGGHAAAGREVSAAISRA